MRFRPINFERRFIGDRDFGESVQLDEVALQRSQSIGTKAMKAALRGKRVSDKELECSPKKEPDVMRVGDA